MSQFPWMEHLNELDDNPTVQDDLLKKLFIISCRVLYQTRLLESNHLNQRGLQGILKICLESKIVNTKNIRTTSPGKWTEHFLINTEKNAMQKSRNLNKIVF